MKRLLYSFSAMTVALCVMMGGVVVLEHTPSHIGTQTITAEPILPHPAPVDASPPVLELKETVIVGKVHRQATRHIELLHEPTLICKPEWHESMYGGQYRDCEVR